MNRLKRGAILGLVCLVSFLSAALAVYTGPAQAALPADVTRVGIAMASFSPTTSAVTLIWDPVPAVNGGTVSYELEKSVDGGLTFQALVAAAASPWTDDNAGLGVPNYTNVMYRLRAKETVGESVYYSVNYKIVNAFPPSLNAHDNYQRNTDLCHSCHSVHTGQAPYLMNQPTATAVCLTCHEGLTNSKYNVVDGYTKVDGGIAPSLGGALAHQAAIGDVWNGNATTSAHAVDEVTLGAAPGGANVTQIIGCTTCHSGHGTGNYRNLKTEITVPTGVDTTVTIPLDIKAGAVTASGGSGEQPVYLQGTSALCRSCHWDYAVGTGSGGSGSAPVSEYGTPGIYRHPTGVAPASKELSTALPLEGTMRDNTDFVVCLTCHYAHGTVAQDANVSTVVAGDGTTTTTSVSTALKRMDGMGICQDCHKK